MKHLGEAIKEELNGQERSVTWFARQDNYRVIVPMFTEFSKKRALTHICWQEFLLF